MKRLSLIACLLVGCAAPSWDGTVERWGTLREVLRDGDTSGKVRLDAVEGSVGVGAMEGLAGEITLVGGRIWIARPNEPVSSTPRPDDRAAFLAVADVPAWSEPISVGPIDLDALEARIAELAQGRETVPFMVEGEFVELEAHVLNGTCPFAADPALRSEPFRFHHERVRGRLVGFFTTLPAGTLTHHGTRLHAHALLDDGSAMGHVDRAVIAGTLRVPVH